MLRVSPRTEADMTFLISARDRLKQAAGLAAVLDAAYDAFESMRLAFRVHEDPASRLFAAFLMAAAAAADGRDAVAFAPSIPPRRRHGAARDGQGPPGEYSAERFADEAAGLSQVVAACLARAAGSASDPCDRDACEQAARCAREICDLLGGAGP
jgi:hypothetical protein